MTHTKLFNIIVLISLSGLVLSASNFSVKEDKDVNSDNTNKNPFALTKEQDEARMIVDQEPNLITKLMNSAKSFWDKNDKSEHLPDSHSTVVSTPEKRPLENSTIDEFPGKLENVDKLTDSNSSSVSQKSLVKTNTEPAKNDEPAVQSEKVEDKKNQLILVVYCGDNLEEFKQVVQSSKNLNGKVRVGLSEDCQVQEKVLLIMGPKKIKLDKVKFNNQVELNLTEQGPQDQSQVKFLESVQFFYLDDFNKTEIQKESKSEKSAYMIAPAGKQQSAYREDNNKTAFRHNYDQVTGKLSKGKDKKKQLSNEFNSDKHYLTYPYSLRQEFTDDDYYY